MRLRSMMKILSLISTMLIFVTCADSAKFAGLQRNGDNGINGGYEAEDGSGGVATGSQYDDGSGTKDGYEADGSGSGKNGNAADDGTSGNGAGGRSGSSGGGTGFDADDRYSGSGTGIGTELDDGSGGPGVPGHGAEADDGVANGHGDIFEGGELPDNCIENQKILVIDLKSGWWGGDGGNSFVHIMKVVRDSCGHPVFTSTEYHHIIQGSMRKKFYDESSLSKYHQVWVLSGSLADKWDLRLDDPMFVSFVNDIANTKVNLFLGSGYGSIDHVNAITRKLFGMNVFQTDQAQGRLLFPDEGVKVLSQISPPSKGLFKGITQIADDMMVGKALARADNLNTNLPKLVVDAKCTHGKPCIGHLRTVKDRRIIFDTGLPRFFALLLPGEVQTKNYLTAITRSLSQK